MKNIIKSLSAPTLFGITFPSLLGVVCWILVFQLNPQITIEASANDAWLADWLHTFIVPGSSFSHALGFVFTLLIAIALFFLNETHSFVRQRTMLPCFLFILLMSTNARAHEFFVDEICCLFFVVALGQLFSSYQKQNSVKQAFNIGFLLSFGSLFTVELLFYIPLFWIGMIIFSSLSFRTLVATIIGTLIPYCFTFGIAFLHNDLEIYSTAFANQFHFGLQLSYSIPFILLMGLLSILVVFTLVGNSRVNKIKVQRILSIVSLLYLYTLILFAFFPNETNALYLISVAFCTILFTNYFDTQNNQFIFYLLLAACLGYFVLTFF
jgi:hypothetical protein